MLKQFCFGKYDPPPLWIRHCGIKPVNQVEWCEEWKLIDVANETIYFTSNDGVARFHKSNYIKKVTNYIKYQGLMRHYTIVMINIIEYQLLLQ